MTIDSFKGVNRFLSNFFPSPVHNTDYYDLFDYPTVEHAYQAAKSMNLDVRKQISEASTPGKAKRAGRRIVVLREDWEDVKLRIMLDLLRDKFYVTALSSALLATGDEQLIEGNTWGDTFWGVCRGVGENHLGRLLMQVRSELRE